AATIGSPFAEEGHMPEKRHPVTECERRRINRLRNAVILFYAAAIVVLIMLVSLAGGEDRQDIADARTATASGPSPRQWRSLATWPTAVPAKTAPRASLPNDRASP